MILLLITITGCRSLPKNNEVVLPPKPERYTQKIPKTTADYALLVLYYETLVQEWEQWAKTVETIYEQ